MLKYSLLLLPLPPLLHLLGAGDVAVFAAGVAAIVPLAEGIREATEQISRMTGSVVGGLLNVTFGNAAELILALFVLRLGQGEVVKSMITGSIIGNGLFGLGLAVVVGGWSREQQAFDRRQAGILSTLLGLCVFALLLPALFDVTERNVFHAPHAAELDVHVSLGVSVVLIVIYAANLVYTLATRHDVFKAREEGTRPSWSRRRAVAVLVAATGVLALEAELVSDALGATAASLGLSPLFLGIVILPVVGNAAEYLSAVYFARADDMTLVMAISLGSTIQIALFSAPVLVIASQLFRTPMDLVFSNPLEIAAVAAVAVTVKSIAQDGETNWFEGLLLLGVYAMIAVTFFFLAR